MFFGFAVQVKGFGSTLCSATKRLIAACKSTTDTEDAALQSSLGELCEESLDGVEPGCRSWGEVEGPARMPCQPLAHLRMLVGCVVVDDGVDRLLGRHLRFDGIEEADELLVPVSLHVAADDGAVKDVEGGEQRGCAVAFVVVGHRSGAAWLHRQTRLGAVERLDLALLIDRENDGMGWRIDIEADDVSRAICRPTFRQIVDFAGPLSPVGNNLSIIFEVEI